MIREQKRFYDKVATQTREDGFCVLLDGREIKTPAQRLLLLPSFRLAQKVAQEFDAQTQKINPSNMSLTRFANTIIDGITDNPHPIAEDIMRSIAADMLFYRAEAPEELVIRQRSAFDPVLDFIETKFGSHFTVGEGVRFINQKRENLDPMRHYVNGCHAPFVLGALHVITTLTASGLLSIAVKEGFLDGDHAWDIAHLDEDWTNEQWGQDAQAMERRQLQRREFDVAVTVLEEAQQLTPSP